MGRLHSHPGRGAALKGLTMESRKRWYEVLYVAGRKIRTSAFEVRASSAKEAVRIWKRDTILSDFGRVFARPA